MYCGLPDLDRCCGCLPLRLGVLILGYLSITFSSCMIAIYCTSERKKNVFMVHHDDITGLSDIMYVICVGIDLCFKLLLVFATYIKNILLLNVSCYYALAYLFIVLALETIAFATSSRIILNFLYTPMFVVDLALNLYFYILIRSLTRKLELEARGFENQLVEFVSGDLKAGCNKIFPSTVLYIESDDAELI